jgi:TPP-dependent 2-oxoacid decarboxylase
VNKPCEDVRDSKTDIDEVMKDVKKVALLHPLIPQIDECCEEIDRKIDVAQAELVEAPVLLAGPANYQPKKGDSVADPLANATPSDMQDLGFLSD